MNELDLIFKAATGLIMSYLFYRFKKLEEKADESMNRQEVRELIDDKLKPIEVLQREIKNDISRVDNKLDRILENK